MRRAGLAPREIGFDRSLIGAYGMQGMFVATFLAGIMLIIAAVLHLGNLTAFVPAPVITGFTSGIAVIIALGQIDNFFGTHSEGGSALAKLASYSRLGFHPNMTTTIVALLVVLLMVFFPKKWNAVVPASLVGIIIATAATMIFKLDIATVGDIPKSLMLPDRLSPSQIDWATVPGLLAPAFSIAVLNMLESLLCGASAGRATGVKLNNDQELFAQGVGNMVLPMFGGIPATAALARTSVAVRSGAQTRLTGIFHAVGLLIMMLVLAPIIRGRKGENTKLLEDLQKQGFLRARIDGADGSITQLSLDAGTLQTRLTSAEGNVAALEQTVSDQGARIALVTDANGVNAAAIVAAINDGDSSIALSADKIDLNGITTVADTLHIGSQNSLERKYLIFHKSGAVISATRGDLPELMLSAGKIDLCGELYHNGEPLNL